MVNTTDIYKIKNGKADLELTGHQDKQAATIVRGRLSVKGSDRVFDGGESLQRGNKN